MADLSGIETLNALLYDLYNFGANLTKAVPSVQKSVTGYLSNNFDTQGASSDFPWQPWAESTQKAYKNQPDRSLLRNTTQLENSVKDIQIFNTSPYELDFVANGDHAFLITIHDSGAPSINLPSRRLIAFTDDQYDQMFQDVLDSMDN